MVFDWFTALAQLVNFLILLALLRWLLYGRVKNALRQRQEDIDETVEDAKQREREAEERAREFREKSEQLERERNDTLEQARQDAEQKRKTWLKQARQEAGDQARRWKEQVRRERGELLRRLREKVAGESCAIAGKALRDLADAPLETRVIHHLRRRIDQMDEQARQEAVAPLSGAAQLRVAAAFDWSEDAQNELRHALGQALPGNPEFTFETDESLVCGIEVRGNGHTLGWSVQSYLADFKQDLAEIIEEHAREGDESSGEDNAQNQDESAQTEEDGSAT